MNPHSSTPEDLTITSRDLAFGRSAGSPRHWLGGDPIATAFYNALSASFPQGERFFMDTVRNFKSKADPKLQQQIVAFARAMASFPPLLLLDEPFLGLAPVWIKNISDAIRALQARGTTILMTEQMARPALKLATRGYVMRGGEVRREGPVGVIRDVALAEEYL